MRYLIGGVLIALGFFHGLHVWGIEPGTVINLNGGRFLSFAALDRLASTGATGKILVLLIDGFVVVLGALEVAGRSRFLFRSKGSKSVNRVESGPASNPQKKSDT